MSLADKPCDAPLKVWGEVVKEIRRNDADG